MIQLPNKKELNNENDWYEYLKTGKPTGVKAVKRRKKPKFIYVSEKQRRAFKER
jgi:hypothetical protein